MQTIHISTREEYDRARARGYEPLLDRWFVLDIGLRREIQRDMFGKNNAEGNQKFYNFCLTHKTQVCEECGMPIRNPSAINVSHILSRGAHQECSHDTRNVNILCPRHHAEWENGRRETMRIYPKNQKIIEQLKHDYNVESKCTKGGRNPE